jgi:hypothetical protein|tara:strand:- start:52 stop:582 length:531 start_codon:yes stop_codon:yes gene_type:complete
MPLTKVRAGGYAAGGIIQIQKTQYTDTTSTSCADSTNVILTDLTVNITPTSTSSIIKLEAMINGEWDNSFTNPNSVWFFYRDSTKLSAPAASDRAIGVLICTPIAYDAANATSTGEVAYYTYFDTPSTTSQITYKVGVYQGTGSTKTWYTNRTVGDSDNDQYERGTSFISATEIAG